MVCWNHPLFLIGNGLDLVAVSKSFYRLNPTPSQFIDVLYTIFMVMSIGFFHQIAFFFARMTFSYDDKP